MLPLVVLLIFVMGLFQEVLVARTILRSVRRMFISIIHLTKIKLPLLLFGDVARGVFLQEHPIFLGGQGWCSWTR